jgi:hypothetical protein
MNLPGLESAPRLVIAMYTNEGTRRIQLLAKRIMLYGSLAGVALWVLNSLIVIGRPNEGRWGLGELFVLLALPLVCGGTLWLVAWIVEGFLTSSRHE